MQFYVVNIYMDHQIDLDFSTIPIYFKKIELVESFWTRGLKKSVTEKLYIREFNRKLAAENFLNVCQSSKQIFKFMNYFENAVAKARNLVKNFTGIILSNEAIILEQEDE